MKRKMLFILFSMLNASSLLAQEAADDLYQPVAIESAPILEADSMTYHFQQPAYTGITLQQTPMGLRPWGSAYSFHPFGFYAPFGLGSLWDIHEGFNASVDMGVSVGLGRHNPWRGAHFFTDITGLYAFPVARDWTLALGASYLRYTGWGKGQGEVSLFALANYRINDRLDLTGYLSHDTGQLDRFNPCHTPYLPGFTGPSTTLGMDFGIKVGSSAKVTLGVSVTRENRERF